MAVKMERARQRESTVFSELELLQASWVILLANQSSCEKALFDLIKIFTRNVDTQLYLLLPFRLLTYISTSHAIADDISNNVKAK